jgi:hypothetical protein
MADAGMPGTEELAGRYGDEETRELPNDPLTKGVTQQEPRRPESGAVQKSVPKQQGTPGDEMRDRKAKERQ